MNKIDLTTNGLKDISKRMNLKQLINNKEFKKLKNHITNPQNLDRIESLKQFFNICANILNENLEIRRLIQAFNEEAINLSNVQKKRNFQEKK